MPITLGPLSRRRFLSSGVAAGVSWIVAGRARGDGGEEIDPNRFVLMADTHIAENRTEVVRGANMFAHFEQAGRQVQSLSPAPSGLIINGDCAYLTGKAGDYTSLIAAVRPLRKAGLPVHFALGNHDHRERFWKAIPPDDGQDELLAGRHLTVLEAPRANWFLLDSLHETNHTPGTLGEKQRQWLSEQLAARKDKPAIVVAHHDPNSGSRTTGLTDTEPLFDVLAEHAHVKAYVFGHTHNWNVRRFRGIHLVNLPPVAYVFGRDRPSGWVDARLHDSGMTLRLTSLDAGHPQHGEKVELKWRT